MILENGQMNQHGPWKIVNSHSVYTDPWLTVRRDDVIRPDGKPGTYSVVNLKPGVSVLAIDSKNNVYLTEEFHYGVGRVTLETVSGGIEADESPLLAAQRELQEEIGIKASTWHDLGRCDPFTASVVSPTSLFLACDLTIGDASPEGTEQIQCVELSFSEAIEKVMNNEITHAPSCLVILKAARFLGIDF